VLTNQDYLYVRRPGYYVGAFFGQRATTMVRGGTGFWWHPQAGTLIHAQQTNTGCWATVLPGGNPDANGDLVAEYLIGDQAWDGTRSVPGDAPVRVRYHTATSSVSTELTLATNMLTRAVRATTAATEQIPLVLQPEDVVSFTNGTPAPYNQTVATTADGITIRRGPTVIAVAWGSARPVTLSTSTRTYLRDARRRIHVLRELIRADPSRATPGRYRGSPGHRSRPSRLFHPSVAHKRPTNRKGSFLTAVCGRRPRWW
jgi:hypothetical protein